MQATVDGRGDVQSGVDADTASATGGEASDAFEATVAANQRMAQQLERLYQLTGGLVHDFNNLLMAVLGNLDLLRTIVDNDPRARRLIDGAIQGAERGAALTQHMLAVARREELKAQPVDVPALADSTVEMLRGSSDPNIQVKTNSAADIRGPRIDKTPPCRIVVVDDDPIVGACTVAMLESLGHIATVASSGRTALKLLQSDQNVDLVISDDAMPGMTGTELAMRIRRRWPQMPVVIATGYADLPNAGDPALPRLWKPYRQPDLADIVARLVSPKSRVALRHAAD